MNAAELKTQVEAAWADRTLLQQQEAKDAIAEVMAGLDAGTLRVAQPLDDGTWQVNEWVKQAVLLNFPIQKWSPKRWALRIPRQDAVEERVCGSRCRVVPHAVVRHGAFVAKDCILMPSYVNLGALCGERTMVDTWATVGSCAQIGADVHLSGVWALEVCLNRFKRPPSLWRMGRSSGRVALWWRASVWGARRSLGQRGPDGQHPHFGRPRP